MRKVRLKYQNVLLFSHPILYANHVFTGAASDMKKAEVVGRHLHIIWTHLALQYVYRQIAVSCM